VTKNSDLTELKRQIERSFNAPDSRSGDGTITGKAPRTPAVNPSVQLGMRFRE
jgi:hypothetical protein